jgi:hypothetical protein
MGGVLLIIGLYGCALLVESQNLSVHVALGCQVAVLVADTIEQLQMKGVLMSHNRNRFALFLLVVLLCMGPVANTAVSQDKHEEFWRLEQTVQDILAGKNAEQTTSTIAKGARLVYGVRFENLKGVVAGDINTCSLADTSYHGVEIVAETNASEDAGYIILKTKKSDPPKVRFHTVVFMKDSTGVYRIHSWHAGETL